MKYFNLDLWCVFPPLINLFRNYWTTWPGDCLLSDYQPTQTDIINPHEWSFTHMKKCAHGETLLFFMLPVLFMLMYRSHHNMWDYEILAAYFLINNLILNLYTGHFTHFEKYAVSFSYMSAFSFPSWRNCPTFMTCGLGNFFKHSLTLHLRSCFWAICVIPFLWFPALISTLHCFAYRFLTIFET